MQTSYVNGLKVFCLGPGLYGKKRRAFPCLWRPPRTRTVMLHWQVARPTECPFRSLPSLHQPKSTNYYAMQMQPPGRSVAGLFGLTLTFVLPCYPFTSQNFRNFVEGWKWSAQDGLILGLTQTVLCGKWPYPLPLSHDTVLLWPLGRARAGLEHGFYQGQFVSRHMEREVRC